MFAAQRDHHGEVLITTREMAKGHFAPGHSPSGPARKMLWLLTHLAHHHYAQQQQSGGWPADHTLEFTRASLRISRHESADRVKGYLLELKGTVYATASSYRGWEGERFISLLEDVFFPTSEAAAAPVLVRFHPIFLQIFSDKRLGEAYGRLHLPVLLGLESKYAVTLYGIGQTLLHLSDRERVEEIPIAQVRTRLGLEDGQWRQPGDILRMLQSACAEVSRLALSFTMTVEPVRLTTSSGPAPTRGRGAAIKAFKIFVHPCTEDEILQPADLTGLSQRAADRLKRVLPAGEVMAESVKQRRAAVTRRYARKVEETAAREQARIAKTDARMDKLAEGSRPKKAPDPTIDRSQWSKTAPWSPGAASRASAPAAPAPTPAAAPAPSLIRRTHAVSASRRGEDRKPGEYLEKTLARIAARRAESQE